MPKALRTAVVGPGALGTLFAVRLARSGATVTLVDHQQDRIARLNQSGLTVDGPREAVQANVSVSNAIPNGCDLILICVKAYATSQLRLPTDTPVLTIQNGLNNVETLAEMVGSKHLLAGVTTEAANMLGEGHVRHAAEGVTTFGSWTACPTDAAEDLFKQAGLAYAITDSPGQVIWEKVAINAGINPLTALLNVPNGHLLRVREIRELLRDLVVEASKVATTEGYRFSRSLVEAAEEVCDQTGDNISSMLQDIRSGKRTEIDAINGEILRRAEAASLPVPRTRVMLQLIRGLESR